MNTSRLRSLVFVLLLVPLLVAAKPLMGFAVSFKTDGFFSKTLTGAEVISVRPSSPAASAGLKVGDRVIELNGNLIKGANAAELQKKIASMKPGEHLVLKVERSGKGLLSIDIGAGS